MAPNISTATADVVAIRSAPTNVAIRPADGAQQKMCSPAAQFFKDSSMLLAIEMAENRKSSEDQIKRRLRILTTAWPKMLRTPGGSEENLDTGFNPLYVMEPRGQNALQATAMLMLHSVRKDNELVCDVVHKEGMMMKLNNYILNAPDALWPRWNQGKLPPPQSFTAEIMRCLTSIANECDVHDDCRATVSTTIFRVLRDCGKFISVFKADDTQENALRVSISITIIAGIAQAVSGNAISLAPSQYEEILKLIQDLLDQSVRDTVLRALDIVVATPAYDVLYGAKALDLFDGFVEGVIIMVGAFFHRGQEEMAPFSGKADEDDAMRPLLAVKQAIHDISVARLGEEIERYGEPDGPRVRRDSSSTVTSNDDSSRISTTNSATSKGGIRMSADVFASVIIVAAETAPKVADAQRVMRRASVLLGVDETDAHARKMYDACLRVFVLLANAFGPEVVEECLERIVNVVLASPTGILQVYDVELLSRTVEVLTQICRHGDKNFKPTAAKPLASVSLRRNTAHGKIPSVKQKLTPDARKEAERLVNMISTRLYSLDASSGGQEVSKNLLEMKDGTRWSLQDRLITVLGRLGERFADEHVSELILGILLQRLATPGVSPTSYSLILREMGGIAAVCSGTSCDNVSDQLLQILTHGMWKEDEEAEVQAALKACSIMSHGLHRWGGDSNSFALKVVRTFNQLYASGAKLRRQNSSSGTGRASNAPALDHADLVDLRKLRVMIPVIAACVGSAKLDKETDKTIVGQFITMWTHFVNLNFVRRSTDAKVVTDLTQIATHSPTLLSLSVAAQLMGELETGPVNAKPRVSAAGAVKSAEEQILGLKELRSDLVALTDSDVKNRQLVQQLVQKLSRFHCEYLLSVYYCEILRSRAQGFGSIFKYLDDRALSSIAEISSVIGALSCNIFKACLNEMSILKRQDRANKERLQKITLFLQGNFNHKQQRIRLLADTFLADIVSRFEFLLWSPHVVYPMLDFLGILSATFTDDLHHSSDGYKLTVPSTDFELTVPDDVKDRRQLTITYAEYCKEWLKFAADKALEETQSLLQVYLISSKDRSMAGLKMHAGMCLASEYASYGLNGASKNLPSSLLEGVPDALKNSGSSFMAGVQIMAQYYGEIAGMDKMLRTYDMVVAENDQPYSSNLSLNSTGGGGSNPFVGMQERRTAILKVLMRDLIAQGRSHRDGTRVFDAERFSDAMYRTAAHIVLVTQLATGNELTHATRRDALHAIVWAPFYLFNLRAVEAGIFCWRWMINECPDLEQVLLAEICSGLNFSRNHKMGIFSTGTLASDPLYGSISSTEAEEADDPATPGIPQNEKVSAIEGMKVHNSLFGFLQSRFHVEKTFSQDLIHILTICMHRMLDNPDCLTLHPQSLPVRFRVLNFVLLLSQSPYVSLIDRYYLKSRAYRAGIEWFQTQPNHSKGPAHAIREPLVAMCSFFKTLKNESKHFKALEMLFLSDTSSASKKASTNPDAVTSAQYTMGALDGFGECYVEDSIALGSDAALKVLSAIEGDGRLAPLRLGSAHGASDSRSRRSGRSRRTAVSNSEKAEDREDASHNPLLADMKRERRLLLNLLRSEVTSLSVWHNPHNHSNLCFEEEEIVRQFAPISERKWKDMIHVAWRVNPRVAVMLTERLKLLDGVRKEVEKLVRAEPMKVIDCPLAVQFLTARPNIVHDVPELRYLLIWDAVPPIQAIAYFSKLHIPHPLTSQYAVSVLESFPPDVIIFYVPQLVQALRYDGFGYVSEYMLTAANKSPIIQHQLLWNMQTNAFSDEDGEVPDVTLGPLLDYVQGEILSTMSPVSRDFYSREFGFFNQVTGISGVLKPYPKAERRTVCKKELSKVKLVPGSYLPSNPEGIVVGIDYNSGIPMQSAAKAPFLATFFVVPASVAELETLGMTPIAQDENGLGEDVQTPTDVIRAASVDANEKGEANVVHPSDAKQVKRKAVQKLNQKNEGAKFLPRHLAMRNPVAQSCIFKVGDDVRQDMLALQVIALFRKIYDTMGLDLYLFPYRVVATGPGMGVIEVVPNTKSRDQLGRQTEMSLFEYFIKTYGTVDSPEFQQARSDFIRSMAAYSIVTYILQIKDRHNGNLLVDKDGHVVHIDFGFMFDSSPGGNIGFEPDIKLTEEMVQIMGGDMESFPFKRFEELTIQAFMAVRPYCDSICTLVALMTDTGLPCFRPESLKRLRARFLLDKTDTEAAAFVCRMITVSFRNVRTTLYDAFQYWQNGIPY
eukprot:Clim_evm33s34 gene=Clim_evmTU33s34